MSSFVRALVVLVGLVLASSAAPAHATPASEKSAFGLKDKMVTVQLEFPQYGVVSPGPYGPSYSCLTGIFAPFTDLDHWDVGGVFFFETRFGAAPVERFDQLYAPYDDTYNYGGRYPFPAVAGTHHSQLSTFPQGTEPVRDSSTEAQCALGKANAQATYGTTATIVYHPDSKCAGAAAKAEAATKAVKAAKRKVASTTGKAHTQAVAALAEADAKLDKAKKKFKAACPKP